MVHENKKLVLAGLEENNRKYGARFCPCLAPYLFEQDNKEDYICPCKEFRVNKQCHCGLFGGTEGGDPI